MPKSRAGSSSSHRGRGEFYIPESRNALILPANGGDAMNLYEEHLDDAASMSEGTITEKALKNRTYTFITRSKGQSYTCGYCQKVLRYRSKYLEHLRIHTGERPFKCRVCHQSFTQGGALKQHERIHTGVKPHTCLYCSKTFRTASYLTVHMRSHETITNGTIAHFGSALSGAYFEQGQLKIEEPEEYEEPEYVQVYEEPEDEVFTHQWRVNHIPQSTDDTSQTTTETELILSRFSDGRLQVNNSIVEGEHYPEDGITLYYFTLSNNQVLTFLYDSVNDSIEIVEPNDGDIQTNEVSHQVESHHTDNEQYVESHEAPFEVYETVASDDVAESSEYEESYHRDVEHKDEEPVEYVTVSSNVIYAQPVEGFDGACPGELVAVGDGLLEEQVPGVIYQKNYISTVRTRHRRPKNLEWIINAIASGKKLEEATPHRRKKPTMKDCEICGLALKYPSKIAAHMRTHTGEKPFECHICHRRFGMNTTLRMHVRRHLKEREFHCAYPGCEKTFVNGALLNHHIQTRHFVRRKYACLVGCGSTFFSNKDRVKHEETCELQQLDGLPLEGNEIHYEEFINPATGETESWVYVPQEYVGEETWNDNAEHATGDEEESVQ